VPTWLDGRLVLGVLLVLVSVVVGARVLSTADRSSLVWAAATDLTAGSQLSSDDLQPVRVRLFETGSRYLAADGEPPVGYVVDQAVGAGELLPQDALSRPGADVDFRLVTVPVEAGHYPPALREESRVDLWVTPERDPSLTQDGAVPPAASTSADEAPAGPTPAGPTPAGPAPAASTPADQAPAGPASPPAPPSAGTLALRGAQQVLASVVVVDAPEREDLAVGGSAVPVVLRVRPDQVDEVVSAMGLGRLDLVRVPRAAEARADLGAVADGATGAAG
jgi:hypothetical protein